MIGIRVIDYNGDFDTLSEVNLIGPYESVESRDAEIARLAAMDGMLGIYELTACQLDDGDYVHAAEAVAAVDTADAFGEVIYS